MVANGRKNEMANEKDLLEKANELCKNVDWLIEEFKVYEIALNRLIDKVVIKDKENFKWELINEIREERKNIC